MIGIHQKKIIGIQDRHKLQISAMQDNALRKLSRIQRVGKNADEIAYLDEVIGYFNQPDFLTKLPEELTSLVRLASQVPIIDVYNARRRVFVRKTSPVKDEILKALSYKTLRSTFYPKYFQQIGIKTCIYCNANYTITAIKNRNEYIGKFDVDHYHSKDAFPFISISLFNLYPACSSCNRAKSNKQIKFKLYTDDNDSTNFSSFSFVLNPHTKAQYLTTKDSSVLDFKFIEPPITNSNTFQETFHVKEIYETQKDLIEELIIKSQIYNQSYLKRLRSDFSKLSLNSKLFERVLVGNYVDDKDLHKRALAKFTMDIAKQLNLIE